ncbi:hypothetical protein ES703_09147 [subsurface metagenome]
MQKRKTEVTIDGDKWLINGRPTYEGREYRGWKIEGLLLNSRMIQAIFDDENETTRALWGYPDTGEWDPSRNTAEFVAAMPEWRQHGLIGITIGLQGGMPALLGTSSTKERLKKLGIKAVVYSQPWNNSAFDANGNLKKSYLERLKQVLDQADILGMVVILDLFYWGQDQRLHNEGAIQKAVEESCGWVLEQGYTNVVIEIANECDLLFYEHGIFRPHRIHELVGLAKNITQSGRRLLVSTSFVRGVPYDSLVATSDFILVHGNSVGVPAIIRRMVAVTRDLPSYRPMPILFNEDNHYDFHLPDNNFIAALASYAGWGLYTQEGFQDVPATWRINTPRQRAFFKLLAQVTGSA